MIKVVVSCFGIFALSACTPDEIVGVKGIQYSASARVATESYGAGNTTAPPVYHLTTTAILKNVSGSPVRLNYGGCPLHTVLRLGGNFGGAIVYDSGRDRACPSIAITPTLAPGDSIVLTDRVVPRSGYIPAGTYRVSAVVDVEGLSTFIGAGIVRIENR